MPVLLAFLAASMQGFSAPTDAFTCTNAVKAFDVSAPSKEIGVFQSGTILQLLGTADSNGMVAVSFQPPQGAAVKALCRAEDVGRGGAKAASSETGFAKTDIYQRIKDKLVDGQGKAVDPGRLARSKCVILFFSTAKPKQRPTFAAELKKFYDMYKDKGLEVIFVCYDPTKEDQFSAMRSVQATWPALDLAAIGSSQVTKFAGPDVPCIAVLDGSGAVIAGSYTDGYMELPKVLQEVAKRL
ncbi:MAG: hypothetical protein HY360_03125 [Verrucomicrobia bacterium]|nr:hypothetical protein [Verrucomicrobiota bacterium]